MINEFRSRGPAGANDEFIELRNDAASAANISGWRIESSSQAGATSILHLLGAGIVLNPGCHYLIANSGTGGYSGSPLRDAAYGTGFDDDGGLALRASDGAIADAVGMSTGSAFKKGLPLQEFGTSNTDRSYKRAALDTNNNRLDFVLSAPSSPINRAGSCTTR